MWDARNMYMQMSGGQPCHPLLCATCRLWVLNEHDGPFSNIMS